MDSDEGNYHFEQCLQNTVEKSCTTDNYTMIRINWWAVAERQHMGTI